ncbi:hypothetical protein KSF73_14320 [Burkholderiaceae bacterium DAT-1]|nr:hypothetical protein [Burkholderiaceae bacterium DAT-1]
MTISELQQLLDCLKGEVVFERKIVGNAICLWFSVSPQSSNAQCLWLDVPWRLESADKVVASSYGFPWERDEGESAEQYRSRFDSACSKSNVVNKAQVVDVVVDHLTRDLTIVFQSGLTLKTFVVDLEEENWHFTDYRAGKRYGVSVAMIDVSTV